MIIDYSKKICVIETPHCGSRFIRKNLKPYEHLKFYTEDDNKLKRHCTVKLAKGAGELPKQTDDYTVYYMVRHPEDRMVSYYYEELASKRNKQMQLNEFIKHSLYNERFTKQFAADGSLYEHYNPNKSENFISLKYEDFDKSIETIFNALDLEKPDTKIKVNKHKIEEKINRESRALINNIFDKDFKEYNYRKRNRYSAKY
jgi:hypothetical protein|tara:strand:- start:172 stop:774 length:603 start_codon:yes stop_codon:yes gene_type:complete